MRRNNIIHKVFSYNCYFDDQETTLEIQNVKMLEDFGPLKKDEEFDLIHIEYPREEVRCYRNRELIHCFKIGIIAVKD